METEHSFIRTKAEKLLTKALNKEQICFKQNYNLEGYEVDFWIAEAGLVIEVDGFSHLSNIKLESDRTKDRKLQEKGYTVIRIDNRQVYDNLEKCISEIKTLVQKIKFYRQQADESVNSAWKEALKSLKQQFKSIEMKNKKISTVEDYFLSLDQEMD